MSRIDSVLKRSPLQWAYERRADHRLAVLAYHAITDPVAMAAQIDYLRAHTNVVSLADARRAWQGDIDLPRRPVLITFDDADRSLLDHGIELLADRELPSVAFVVAGLVDSEEPFWWDEVAHLVAQGGRIDSLGAAPSAQVVGFLKRVPNRERLAKLVELRASASGPAPRARQLSAHAVRELAANGFTIGSHSLTHPCLDQCTDTELELELVESRNTLGRILGTTPEALAYPNGNHDQRVVAAARRAGYTVAFLFDHRVGPLEPSDTLGVSRVRVNSSTSLDRFATIVSGLHPAVHHGRGRR